MSTILTAKGLNVFYGPSQVLFNLDLSVEQGQTLALLGRNGAGKSTTFKSLIGLAPPKTGSITFGTNTVHGLSPDVIARRGIGYVPEDRQVFPDHSVLDNLQIGTKAGANGERPWSLDRVYGVFPRLSDLRDRRAGSLSGGEQQMLTIARTLMGNPDLLLLDEPSEGLAPIIVEQIGELIRDLAAAGVTMIVAEQNMHFCLGIASHAAVIDKGSVVWTGTIADLRANDEVTKRYLAV
jgi:branched-chain amino acid transport system ATP-binding protein